MKIIRASALLCIFLFALGAFAQYPAGQSSPGQTGMGQSNSPTMNPGQAGTPSQSNPSPGMSNPQQSQQPQPGTSGAQGSDRAPTSAPPSLDAQVSVLTTELNLTPDQQTKARTILQDQHSQAMTIVQDSTLTRDDKLTKIHALRASTISKMRDTLNDDQKKKFDTMVQQQTDRVKQQQNGPGAGSSTNNPSQPPK